jgi:hypothetical protein
MKVRTPERPWIKDSFVRRLRVPAITLDQLFEKNHISKADILKMDVEGMEYDILKGTSVFPRIEKLVLEYHGLEIKTKLLDLLAEKGFRLVFEEKTGTLTYGDLYFVKRP